MLNYPQLPRPLPAMPAHESEGFFSQHVVPHLVDVWLTDYEQTPARVEQGLLIPGREPMLKEFPN